MKIYLLSPQEVPANPHLFPMFSDTWEREGFQITGDIEESDLVFFDLHTRISDYRQSDIDWVVQNKKPVVTFDEWDRGGLSRDCWPEPLTEQQRNVMIHISGRSVHFCRSLDRKHKPLRNIFPFEKPFLYDEPLVSEDELFNREYDIVWIANTAPQRECFKKILSLDSRFKCYILLGGEKMPFEKWVCEHKKGKMFVSWSGGGITDERCHNLFSIAAIIREDTNQLLLHDFSDMKNCIKVSTHFPNQDLDKIDTVLHDKSLLHGIYKNGYEFVKKYYSKDHIAKNILTKITNYFHA